MLSSLSSTMRTVLAILIPLRPVAALPLNACPDESALVRRPGHAPMFRDNKDTAARNRAHGGPRPGRNRSADSLRKGKEYVMNKASGRSREAAESLAIQALNFLATEPARLSRFLALSGLEAQSIRTAAAESGFLAGVLTYLGE